MAALMLSIIQCLVHGLTPLLSRVFMPCLTLGFSLGIMPSLVQQHTLCIGLIRSHTEGFVPAVARS